MTAAASAARRRYQDDLSCRRQCDGRAVSSAQVDRSDLLKLVRFIRLETVIAAPAAACFDLSLSVDAHTGSMAASGERAVAGVTSGVMKLGDTVTWRARHFGIAFRMTSAITDYERPIRFVDEQQRGPFQRWWHEHTFTAIDGGMKTLMVDVVEFRSRFGPLGDITDRLLLDRYMPVCCADATHGSRPLLRRLSRLLLRRMPAWVFISERRRAVGGVRAGTLLVRWEMS